MTLMEELAERYPQLYVAPSKDSEEAYKRAVQTGEAPEEKDLSHFIGSSGDWLKTEMTPAGEVEILHLKERADFETFVRIILYRAGLKEILPSVGAQTIIGVRNWKKIREHMEPFPGLSEDDYWEELASFASDKSKSTDILILISSGPYSALPAEQAGMKEEEWLRISQDIRYYHECAHFICRRKDPEKILPLWDELTADLVGMLKAMGRYDPSLAASFLGVSEKGYSEGRLIHYLSEEEKENPDEAASEVYTVIQKLAGKASGSNPEDAYQLLLELFEHPLMNR